MAYVWQHWLAAELRPALEANGLRLVEVEGWRTRGRPASSGSFDPNGASTNHHTGTTTSKSNPMPTLRLLIQGRPDLPGPLSQVGVGYDGTVYLIAAGRANHAGRVGKSGVPGMPYGADGNALAIGDEVDTNGTQALSDEQILAISIVNRVVIDHFNRNSTYVHRHADISGTGKWDLGNRSTALLRADARGVSLQKKEYDEMATKKEIQDAVREVVREELAKSVANNVLDAPLNVKDPGGQAAFQGVSVREALKRLLHKTGAVNQG